MKTSEKFRKHAVIYARIGALIVLVIAFGIHWMLGAALIALFCFGAAMVANDLSKDAKKLEAKEEVKQ